jgi:hypothetical protein
VIKIRSAVIRRIADPINIWYKTVYTLSLYILVQIGTLCPSRYSNPIDVAECGTAVCMYLEFRLPNRFLRFISSIQTSTVISIHNAFCPYMAGCHSYCKGCLVRQQTSTESTNRVINTLQNFNHTCYEMMYFTL